MNDDLQQIREETFDRIILGLALVGLTGSLATFVIGEFSWTWFLRWVALLLVTLIAFLLRRKSQFAVAAYVLVLELIGIVAGIFLQPGLITGSTPYLFIPIIIIAGLILSPLATLGTATFSVFMALGIIAFKGQTTTTQLIRFLPPFTLTFIIAVLVAEGSRFVNKLGKRLEKKKIVLQEHSTGLVEALDKAEKFRQKVARLEKELGQARARAGQKEQMASQKDKRLYDLIQGTAQELGGLEQELRTIIEKIEAIPRLGGQESFFEDVWEKLNYLENILHKIEELAWLENRNVALNYQTIEVTDLIRQAVATAQEWVNTKDVKLSYRVVDDLPELQADPDLLQQALLHVLENAAKYTDQGMIEIQADLTEEDELIIFVSDTGIGMYREEMDLIFEKFGRGRGTLAQQRRGAGLGLAISQQLIELHGGRMWVSSVLGVGSTFYMTLPLELEPAKAMAPAASNAVTPMTIPATAAAVAASASPESAAGYSTSREDREATLVSSELNTKVFPTFTANETNATQTKPPGDEDQTLLSTHPSVKSNFGPPVARFGPTYISRFGLILLGLLLIIAGVVATLAIFNGPNDPEEAGSGEVEAPSNAVVETSAGQTPRPEAASTSPPTTTSFATPTLPPTTTPITPTRSTATLPSLPTKSLLSTPSPTPTKTPTSVPTQEPAPTLAPPSPTSARSATVTSDVDQGSAVSPAELQVTTMPARQISFIVDQGQDRSIMLQNLDEASGISLVAAVKIANNSRVSWSPSGQLLFSADTGGDPEIYISQADDNEPQQLTQAAGDDIQPAWSPDGRQIAFSSGRTGNLDIYVMDAAGLDLQQLTTSRGFDEWPVWSPDGRQIAFVSNRDGNVEIYTMNADGSQQQRLTDHPADDLPPAWSPDGSRLVFSSRRDSNWNLYLINTDGNHLQRLTDDPANEQDPVWSADGRTIAFTYDGTGNLDIYTVSVPTPITEIPRSAWTQITDTPVNEQAPVWLP